MKSKQTAGKIVKVISATVAALLLFGAIAFVYKFTSGGKEELKSYYLVYGDKEIIGGKGTLMLEKGSEAEFGIKRTLPIGDPLVFSVTVSPNEEEDFAYLADGETKRWAETNLGKVFGIEKKQSGFVLKVPEDISLKAILETANGDKEILLPDETKDKESRYIYTMAVTAEGESTTYEIRLKLFEYGLTLADEEVLF